MDFLRGCVSCVAGVVGGRVGVWHGCGVGVADAVGQEEAPVGCFSEVEGFNAADGAWCGGVAVHGGGDGWC